MPSWRLPWQLARSQRARANLHKIEQIAAAAILINTKTIRIRRHSIHRRATSYKEPPIALCDLQSLIHDPVLKRKAISEKKHAHCFFNLLKKKKIPKFFHWVHLPSLLVLWLINIKHYRLFLYIVMTYLSKISV